MLCYYAQLHASLVQTCASYLSMWAINHDALNIFYLVRGQFLKQKEYILSSKERRHVWKRTIPPYISCIWMFIKVHITHNYSHKHFPFEWFLPSRGIWCCEWQTTTEIDRILTLSNNMHLLALYELEKYLLILRKHLLWISKAFI